MNDFLAELYKLMYRYDADITVIKEDVSELQELHGDTGEAVWVRVGYEHIKLADDCGMYAYDLKAYLDANVMQSQTLGENLDESHE